jgi:hypothetical protein
MTAFRLGALRDLFGRLDPSPGAPACARVEAQRSPLWQRAVRRRREMSSQELPRVAPTIKKLDPRRKVTDTKVYRVEASRPAL